MDRIDHAIVRELTQNARVSFRDLGERVNLSANAVAERVRRLVASGVIRGFHAHVSPEALGFRMSAYVDVKTGSSAVPGSVLHFEDCSVTMCAAAGGSAI